MRRLIITMAVLLAAGCEELAPPPAIAPATLASYTPVPDTIVTPPWAERAPTAADIHRVYPPAAQRAGMTGLVYLDCLVGETRMLACTVGEDMEPGRGFDVAALEVAKLFIVKEGYPKAGPGARVRVPIRFELAG